MSSPHLTMSSAHSQCSPQTPHTHCSTQARLICCELILLTYSILRAYPNNHQLTVSSPCYIISSGSSPASHAHATHTSRILLTFLTMSSHYELTLLISLTAFTSSFTQGWHSLQAYHLLIYLTAISPWSPPVHCTHYEHSLFTAQVYHA